MLHLPAKGGGPARRGNAGSASARRGELRALAALCGMLLATALLAWARYPSRARGVGAAAPAGAKSASGRGSGIWDGAVGLTAPGAPTVAELQDFPFCKWLRTGAPKLAHVPLRGCPAPRRLCSPGCSAPRPTLSPPPAALPLKLRLGAPPCSPLQPPPATPHSRPCAPPTGAGDLHNELSWGKAGSLCRLDHPKRFVPMADAMCYSCATGGRVCGPDAPKVQYHTVVYIHSKRPELWNRSLVLINSYLMTQVSPGGRAWVGVRIGVCGVGG